MSKKPGSTKNVSGGNKYVKTSNQGSVSDRALVNASGSISLSLLIRTDEGFGYKSIKRLDGFSLSLQCNNNEKKITLSLNHSNEWEFVFRFIFQPVNIVYQITTFMLPQSGNVLPQCRFSCTGVWLNTSLTQKPHPYAFIDSKATTFLKDTTTLLNIIYFIYTQFPVY